MTHEQVRALGESAAAYLSSEGHDLPPRLEADLGEAVRSALADAKLSELPVGPRDVAVHFTPDGPTILAGGTELPARLRVTYHRDGRLSTLKLSTNPGRPA